MCSLHGDININPFIPNEIPHPCQWDKSISNVKVDGK